MSKTALWICEASLLCLISVMPGFVTPTLADSSLPEGTVEQTPLTDDYVPPSIATRWGFQLDGTFSAFGGDPIAQSSVEYQSRGFLLQLEYLLPLSEKMGKLGIGPNIGVYTVSADAGVTSGPFSITQYGIQARYQMKYFNHQWVVPSFALMLERLNYDFTFETTESSVWLTGFSGGLWIYLNPWEPSAAASMEATSGISRTYLIAEARALAGESVDLIIGGVSYFFGLRFEL